MNEITAVRELLHSDTTSSPESMAVARARLNEAIRTDAAGPLPVRRRVTRPLRWSLAGTGLLAAAVAAAVVMGSGTAPPPKTSPVPASAQQILLAAATRAEQAPAQTGSYWHVKSVINQQFQVPAGYNVTTRVVNESWNPVRSGDQSWWGQLKLGTHPSTPADVEAWRADGSPTQWRVLFIDLKAEPQKASLIRTTGANSYLGENEVSLADVRQLPTDPEQLRAWLVRRIMAQGGIDSEQMVQSELFGAIVQLLAETPASPAVRAAAFRLLAATPNVHNEGEVRDELGRAGIRIVYGVGADSGEMVIDPTGPQILSHKGTGTPSTSRGGVRVVDATLILTAGWTNDKPQQPTAP
jgi:hypothetical protein